MTLAEAVKSGWSLERDWNVRMFVAGYHAGYLEIPPLGYRLKRALHMTQMTVRENIAIAIAPWLDPDCGK